MNDEEKRMYWTGASNMGDVKPHSGTTKHTIELHAGGRVQRTVEVEVVPVVDRARLDIAVMRAVIAAIEDILDGYRDRLAQLEASADGSE